MDMKKFNQKMGKIQKFSKGGRIKKIAGKHYFDAGGSTTLSGPSSNPAGGATGPTTVAPGITGAVSGALGLNDQFQGQGANIQAGTNAAQLNNAYTGAQTGLAQQQALAGQMQPGTAQGLGTQANLTGQLQGVIAGTGPNAAQTALNQNTATNVANQAALMAGQRGAGANAGMLARQAAQQGAATQQQAVGQAATTQAQQQIAAQQQLADLAAQQVGQGQASVQGVNQTQQNEQNILQGANTAANNANVAMQSNINNVNAQAALANQQQAGNIVSGIGGMAAGLVGLAKGGEVESHHCAGAHCTDRQHSMHMMAAGGPLSVSKGQPKTGVGPWVNSTPDTSGPAANTAAPSAPTVASPFAGIGSDKEPAAPTDTAPGEVAAAENNYGTAANNFGAGATPASVQNFGAQPLSVPNSASAFSSPAPSLAGGGGISQLAPLAMLALAKGGNIAKGPHKSHVANFLAAGGEVPAMVSPGERYLNPEEVKEVVEHGSNPLKMGKKFEGKAKVKGDSLKNDNISTTLQEGGVVLPRHIMNKKNRDHAELFVRRAVHMKSPKGGK
jgi:hypothetical protein